MNTQHTPGPWHVSNDMYGVGNLLVAGVTASNAEPIANCGIGKTGKANARLIAAAPDLLALLQRIAEGDVMAGDFNHAETVHEYQKLARAAIAKATGEAK